MSEDSIIKSTLRGLANARRNYDNWIGDVCWPIPEYVNTVEIARAVTSNNKNIYTSLEENPKATIKTLKGESRGRKSALSRLDGRFDILVWNTRNPIGIIEVKKTQYGKVAIKNDAERIFSVLKKASKLKWGLIAYSMLIKEGKHKSARSRLDARTENINNEVNELAENRGFQVVRHSSNTKTFGKDTEWQAEWRAEVLEIAR